MVRVSALSSSHGPKRAISRQPFLRCCSISAQTFSTLSAAGVLSAKRLAPVQLPPRKWSQVRLLWGKELRTTARSTTPTATSAPPARARQARTEERSVGKESDDG